MEIYSKEHINKFMDKINTEHKIPYKFYEIDNEYKNFFNLLSTTNNINPDINIKTNHQTFPIIFHRNKFIGGYDDFIEKF